MTEFKACRIDVDSWETVPVGKIGIDYAPQRDNDARASFVARALAAYREVVRGDEEVETVMSDFLGDMRHFADAVGVDFDAVNDRGQYHYEAEIVGD